MTDTLIISGVREFRCANCEQAWKDRTKDVLSQTCMECPRCSEITYPISYVIIQPELH